MLVKVLDFFVTGIPNKDGGMDYSFNTSSYVLLVSLIIILLLFIFSLKKESIKIKTKQLVFAGMAIALATVTSFIKFADLPAGGSITMFSMFFICLIGYLYGTKVGLITGFAHGLLQLILGPYMVHPIQIVLDYPLAFGCLGLSGIFSKSKYGIVKGYLLGVFGRFVCHLVSGLIFFASSTPAGSNALIFSLGYNATYIVPEAIATVIILCIPTVIAGLGQVKKMANEA